MRAVLAQLHFNVVKHEPHPKDSAESKVYFSKLLPAEIARAPPQHPHSRPRRVIRPTGHQATGHQDLKASRPQDLKTSRPQDLKTSTHSAFNVTTGSTCVPRRAGRYDATIATAERIAAMAMNVTGSFGPT